MTVMTIQNENTESLKIMNLVITKYYSSMHLQILRTPQVCQTKSLKINGCEACRLGSGVDPDNLPCQINTYVHYKHQKNLKRNIFKWIESGGS
jgi:hypothetical protein